ncbi:MAG TPA: type II toxin-antitoxin system VapC family toxin [Longimicrobiales bacterium]|nr:type II toxin-antitoxin system VapC family toxin [Longimicrobiales bacterium]
MTSVVLDTSALIAVLQNEPEAGTLLDSLERADGRYVSAASVVEAGIVLQARFGDHGERELDLLLQRAEVEIVPVTADHADMARQAFRRFGKGRHPAGLNFGDCFAYALAVALDARLLFTRGDFARTDVVKE